MNEIEDQLIIDSVVQYLIEHNIDFENHDLIRNIKARKDGKTFTFNDNIKAMIYALLSNQTKWMNIAPKLSQIDKLFFNYQKHEILKRPPEYFYDGIFNLKCGNIATKKQMLNLKDNILMLEKIASDYGSLDLFYASRPAYQIAEMISSGKYKLKYVGYALAWEFLRNIGIDGAKPDLHMRRILGGNRLGYTANPIAQELEAIKIFDRISNSTGYLKSYIDIVLWSYCADGYGEVCTADPKCHKCVIKEYCNFIA
ncbi:MAG: hypothetical protein KMY55_01180 [Dethiosulfatibacter sp.]|nr:hypothetical protein [Dethiosulfatibacter sp.]